MPIQTPVPNSLSEVLDLNILAPAQVTYSTSHLEKPDFDELTHRWKGYADGTNTNPLYLLTVRVKFAEPACV